MADTEPIGGSLGIGEDLQIGLGPWRRSSQVLRLSR
jgi:hypothetical protein